MQNYTKKNLQKGEAAKVEPCYSEGPLYSAKTDPLLHLQLGVIVCCHTDVLCVSVSVSNMMAQITSNDDQAVELTDKIAAVEEELRKVCGWGRLVGGGVLYGRWRC